MGKRYIGLDAGSVSVKVVVLDGAGKKAEGIYRPHKGHPARVALELLREVTGGRTEGFSLAVTGSAGRLVAEVLGVRSVNEIVAQAQSTRSMYPHINTVIEMGGEDSKLILMEEAGVRDFAMNSVCAAGTGSFLDQQAERLRLTIEEFSDLSLKSKSPPRIAGRCSVFAKSDMIHLQQIATPVEDIVAGLCFAVARNFRGTIARGRQVHEPVAFHGGVAANKGMVRAFKEVFGLRDLFIPEDFALMGAIGAAMKAAEEGAPAGFELERLEEFLGREKLSGQGHAPLLAGEDDFLRRHSGSGDELSPVPAGPRVRAYMGIDIGSISTNLAVLDDDGNLLAKRYLMTAGRPIEAVRQGLSEIAAEVGDRVEIAGVGTTGSGRYMIADFVGADIVKNEITAQATAAAFIDKGVDTIFEIGGQDSKYISLRDGVIVDFEMNKACAAGTGSFLEEQAEKLDISIKGEFAEKAFCSECPSRLGERCTVFMENSLMANLQKGADRDDLLAGLAYSIVQNYINRVVAGKPVGRNIFFQGGVAFNKSVVAAFEKYLGVRVTVPPNHDVTGAIGMALIARRHMEAAGEGGARPASAFKGFDLWRRSYEQSSFECKGCPNVCEINRVKIEGEKGYLFFGGRCEKYDIKRKSRADLPDLFRFREEALWKAVRPPRGGRPVVGVPYIFFFNDYLPYWATLLDRLGFDVEVSPRTNRAILDLGLECVLSEACFPVKVALGHIRYLKEKGVDAVFVPSFISLNREGDEYPRGLACPQTQTIPYVANVAIQGLRAIAPAIDTGRGQGYLVRELRRAFREFGVGRSAILSAMKAAEAAQAEFERSVKDRGREALAGLRERAIVVVGRGYNAFESGMNLQIPEKLATLGVLSIPMDMLPLEGVGLREDWPNMYWRSGQRILKAARFIGGHPLLYPIYIGNFSCGPDSFILKYFRDELAGKPFLHIEIDEHSADAGAITRCEAFLDSVENRRDGPPEKAPQRRAGSGLSLPRRRTVYMPRMSDHVLALAAAFERCGVPAEVLPETDREAVDIGMRYVSGKECYPCVVTTGDMLKKVFSSDFRPEESAFFMPSGAGPCRFGQYNVFHSAVLEKVGYGDVPVLAPNQDVQFYRDLGVIGKDFTMAAWRGIVAIELLQKCLHETRPYEKEKGAADALYGRYLEKLYFSLRGMDGGVDNVLMDIKRDFEALEKSGEPRPLIGVVGEIFVRSNRFSNEDLVRKIEDLGGEVWLAPVEEWLYYVNLMGLEKALIKRDASAIIDTLLKRFFQKRVEHGYARYFENTLRTLKEPSTKDIIEKAAPYVHRSFEGETILSVGKAVDLIERGACGIVNAMPFGCMPGTIVTALMRGITRDFDVPSISIPYDGTESPTVGIQLEAFMEQARGRMKKKAKMDRRR
ncbi:MAG: acyl-CoA dehydratase activase [Thermodesulfovibrionales bacterium]